MQTLLLVVSQLESMSFCKGTINGMTRKFTIRDIAQLAGVSIATVSRVLNHKPDVDPQTRERIMHIMNIHGFAPDLSAVQLAGSPSRRKLSSLHAFPPDFLWGAATSAYQIEG